MVGCVNRIVCCTAWCSRSCCGWKWFCLRAGFLWTSVEYNLFWSHFWHKIEIFNLPNILSDIALPRTYANVGTSSKCFLVSTPFLSCCCDTIFRPRICHLWSSSPTISSDIRPLQNALPACYFLRELQSLSLENTGQLGYIIYIDIYWWNLGIGYFANKIKLNLKLIRFGSTWLCPWWTLGTKWNLEPSSK